MRRLGFAGSPRSTRHLLYRLYGVIVEDLFDFTLCGLDAVAGHLIAACQLGGIERGIGFRQQYLQFP